MPAQRAAAGPQRRAGTSYQQKKAARERLQAVRARVASFVKSVLEPGLREISDELDWPLVEIRQMAHLALPAVVQQRRLTLWQAVVRVAREEHPDWDSAIASAQRTYSQLQDAIANAEWDDPLLVEYEHLRSEMEQGRAIKGMPKTTQQTVRAKLSFVARCHQEMDEKLQIMCNTAGIEFLLVITTGDKAVKFAPFISATRKVLDFLPFKFNTSADQLATEMEGFSLFGSEAYKMLASKNPKHKAEVSRLLTEQLRKLTGKPKATLRWTEDSTQANYDSLGVELIGWPEDITFRPLMFLSNSQARRLHLAVREGAMRFEPKAATNRSEPPTSILTAQSTAAPAAPPARGTAAPAALPARGSRGRRTRQAGPREEQRPEPSASSSASAGGALPARPTPRPSSIRPPSPQASTPHPSTSYPPAARPPAQMSLPAGNDMPVPASPFIPAFPPHHAPTFHRLHGAASMQQLPMQPIATSVPTDMQWQTLPPLPHHAPRPSSIPSFPSPSSAPSHHTNFVSSPAPSLLLPPILVPSQNTRDT